ncbi:pentatricopeptide repeat-containing protein At1g62350-like [Eucalyptus grandis]|uniref:pentatricopeptide repeat-containing protein At1g62350-like n=1 Tax=Eucalyptus grandis TaxID=71139 RepID=UPI00192ED6D0|nr:pentatricopeptide repeat-containing protein At1g62350-like [Eucalyptus grandis]
MEASLSLPFRSVRPRLHRAPATASFVTCGLRNSIRRPLWRSDVLSTEAIRAVQSLKLAKSTPRLNHVLSTTLARLLKSDLLNTFAELKRQNEVDFALKVSPFSRPWFWVFVFLAFLVGFRILSW